MCLTKQNQISECGMFPSVYVWVRQWAAWKLHPYNSIAQHMFSFVYQNLCPFGPKFGILCKSLWPWHSNDNVSTGKLVNNSQQITLILDSRLHYHWKCLLPQLKPWQNTETENTSLNFSKGPPHLWASAHSPLGCQNWFLACSWTSHQILLPSPPSVFSVCQRATTIDILLGSPTNFVTKLKIK